MGMYDYLGGEPIKIFYRPIFDDGSHDPGGKPNIRHSGGTLADYTNGELPLHTMYYKYPDSFIVFDFRWGNDLWVIKDGKFKELKSIKDIKESDLGEAAYDYYGRLTNVKTVEDIKAIGVEFNEGWKANRDYENKH